MRFTRISLSILASVLLLVSSCTLLVNDNVSTAGGPEVQAFQRSIMTTFDVNVGNTDSSSRGLNPFIQVNANQSRATVSLGANSFNFPGQNGAGSLVSGTSANYPEPGQTSNWELTAYSGNIYKVEVTTTFPAFDIRDNQVESYYVTDTNNDGIWSAADGDVIVRPDGTPDAKYRIGNRLTYRDGSYQDEVITTVKFGAEGYGAFNIDGTLDYPQLFVPVASGALFSSVVAYTRTFATSPAYSFWSGHSVKTIVGIRYYTEHDVNGKRQADMVVFEKAVTDLTTLSGDFVQAASSLFLPGVAANPNPTLLSQSVLRQRIVYALNSDSSVNYASAIRDTRMKTLVVNISGQRDFYINKISQQATALSSTSIEPLTSTIFIPSGDATEVLASDPGAAVNTKSSNSTFKTGDSSVMSIISNAMGGTDLGALWVSIEDGQAVNLGLHPDVDGDLTGTSDVKIFNGVQGILLPEPDPVALYSFNNKGTVQAWVYINAQSDTAGIIHAGKRSDFLDEIWSLQFMGSKGNLAFSLSSNDGAFSPAAYEYDYITSGSNLAVKKWYYVVASWDRTLGQTNSFMKLYVNGVLSRSGKFSNLLPLADSQFGVVSSPVVIGSQFYDSSKVLSGYYGFNGKINGVLISNQVWTAQEILNHYNANKAKTLNW